MTNRATRLLLLLLLTVAVVAPATAAPPWGKKKQPAPEEQEVDHVALAGLLIKDGHYDRAEAVLGEVDLEAEGVDLARFHMLKGLIQLKTSRYAEARDSLRASVAAGQEDKLVFVFLAQAHLGLEEFAETIAALDQAGATAHDIPGTFLIRAQSHWRLENHPAAWEALEQGIARYPEEAELRRHRVLLLVDMKLFQAALDEGQQFLEREDSGAEDVALISEALIRGNQSGVAVRILEGARLRFPDDINILLQLARAYLQEGHTLTAASLFARASQRDPQYTIDAAELFRRGGRTVRALHLNARVTDQAAKVKQRLSLLIELERYEEAAALEPRLSRLGLLAEDEVAYALAYALFQNGEFHRAERRLTQITDAELFRKAAELRRAMERCRAAGWECY
jgi:predicted Zn-dependent protease